jgi:hypothetical protein
VLLFIPFCKKENADLHRHFLCFILDVYVIFC